MMSLTYLNAANQQWRWVNEMKDRTYFILGMIFNHWKKALALLFIVWFLSCSSVLGAEVTEGCDPDEPVEIKVTTPNGI